MGIQTQKGSFKEQMVYVTSQKKLSKKGGHKISILWFKAQGIDKQIVQETKKPQHIDYSICTNISAWENPFGMHGQTLTYLHLYRDRKLQIVKV